MSVPKLFLRPALAFAALACGALAPGQIVVGQVDDFEDGTTMGWTGASPINIPTGGPSGSGDNYLQVTGTGGPGPGGVPAAFNATSRWTGNYLAAGVTRISVNLLNPGNTQLEIRLVLHRTGGQLSDRWTSTTPFVLAPGGGWQFASFSLAESDLTRVLGSGAFNATITDVGVLQFRHQTGPPSSGGTPLAAAFGLDNIRAVPEPASMAVLGTAFGWFAFRRRRR